MTFGSRLASAVVWCLTRFEVHSCDANFDFSFVMKLLEDRPVGRDAERPVGRDGHRRRLFIYLLLIRLRQKK